MSSAKPPKGVSELTKRLLFGSANHCAFPECSAPLVLVHGRILSINAEVAHIRSPEPGGPRHVAEYSGMHAFENLLLLCSSHHHLIDQHPEEFPVSVLEQWKGDQVAQMGQPVPYELLEALRRQVAELSEASKSQDSDEGSSSGGVLGLSGRRVWSLEVSGSNRPLKEFRSARVEMRAFRCRPQWVAFAARA
ncbi:HNH endonuclease signature motif containing protein [Amycolatopsis sp. BJA-103]|uniref:HNH endonuclease signature motif containing protein n=1 Tax=Amycolatopsis sp. BJA-103 TaxID=1911175 RepID=UPI003519739F